MLPWPRSAQLAELPLYIAARSCKRAQAPGTFHFRTTFLPPEAKMESVMSRLAAYHTQFMASKRTNRARAPPTRDGRATRAGESRSRARASAPRVRATQAEHKDGKGEL